MKNVLIGGGSGFVGRHLSNFLKEKGYGVTVVSRLPGPHKISWDELAVSGLPPDTNAVVSLAGQNVLDPTKRWTPGFKQNVWSSRVNTTQALVQASLISEKKPSVFVSISGVGIYNPRVREEFNEESPVKEFDFLSGLCFAWECAANKAGQGFIRTAIIRSGECFAHFLSHEHLQLYKPNETFTTEDTHCAKTMSKISGKGVVLGRDGGMVKQLWLPFLLGLGGPIGSGHQYLPWIHIDDLVNLITFVIENNEVRGVLNGVSPEVITNRDFTNALAKAMSRPALFPIPAFVLNLAFSPERAKLMTEGQKVIPKRTLESGFKFKYPLIKDAVEQIVSASK